LRYVDCVRALSEQWNGNWRLDAEWVNWPAEDVQLALAG